MDMGALFAEYGLIAVFAVVLLEQLGAPVPAMPLFLLAGALAAQDALYGVWALALAIIASTLGDLVWYAAGRRFGYKVLKLMCRVSLSPDSCVRQTETTFERRGVATLVIAKFVPGLSTLAPPLAGALGVRPSSFLIFNGAGAALWAGAGIVGGLVFHDQIDGLLIRLVDFGSYALMLVAALLALYVAYRWWERRRFAQQLRMSRISVDELQTLIERGEEPLILDVRSRAHRILHGRRIPGAQAVDLDDIESALPVMRGERDIIVYCACPNDASAVKVARLLRSRGIVRVRPLAGGIEAWTAAGLALESIDA